MASDYGVAKSDTTDRLRLSPFQQAGRRSDSGYETKVMVVFTFCLLSLHCCPESSSQPGEGGRCRAWDGETPDFRTPASSLRPSLILCPCAGTSPLRGSAGFSVNQGFRHPQGRVVARLRQRAGRIPPLLQRLSPPLPASLEGPLALKRIIKWKPKPRTCRRS